MGYCCDKNDKINLQIVSKKIVSGVCMGYCCNKNDKINL